MIFGKLSFLKILIYETLLIIQIVSGILTASGKWSVKLGILLKGLTVAGLDFCDIHSDFYV